MRIAGFVKTALSEWEGKNACMILLPGCNFRCPYCNRSLIDSDASADHAEAVDYIKTHRDFVDAVVVSGGEPTVHPELYALLKDLKSLNLKIKIDTNGSMPDVLDDIVGAMLVDKVCINVMAPLDDASYTAAAGVVVDAGAVRRSIDIVSRSGVACEFRTTAVPGIIGSDAMNRISESLPAGGSLIIQQFDPSAARDAEMRKTVPYPTQALVRMAESSKRHVRNVRIRGA
ncbi:MAG: anaerobic ribonucleoside-triphosphate reductase activating protein [Candidatus Methanoplasma sp.]|jgi:pyruvate formate lyase activating enzyme|nr:anaerobic ribonucleoside-triphosphate reductase activating protein [Candidatus Methanoplasma sp.]